MNHRIELEPTSVNDAGARYAAAYRAHYQMRQPREALELYTALIALYPDAQEAEYARDQVRNIVNAAIPRGELLEAETALALARLPATTVRSPIVGG